MASRADFQAKVRTMNDSNFADPFHRGEQEIQNRLGVREKLARIGPRAIKDYLIDQHRAFFEQIPLVFYAALDQHGRPWASTLCAYPGFITSPDPRTLTITADALAGDPVYAQLATGSDIALLGLIFQTQRRNRANGRVARIESGQINIRVHQSFGNCPKYIAQRMFSARQPEPAEPSPPRRSEGLDQQHRKIIENANTFFIATQCASDVDADRNGIDVSHRGGKPGFVRVDDDHTLTWPDFAGNQFFNTLGNILVNPATGLFFIDYATGDLLYMTGHAKILWVDETVSGFKGAERLVQFTLSEIVHATAALPFSSEASEPSPFLEPTGSWDGD